MPHFSKQSLESDPDTLAGLKQVLHGRSAKSRIGRTAAATPSLEERFGVKPEGRKRTLRLVPASAGEP